MSDDSADNEADQNESRGAVGRIIKAVRSLGSSLDEVQRANPAGSRATPQIEVTASEAFRRLLNGNERFCREAAFHPRSDVHYAQTLAIGQRPFAVVVSDADARMCPEVIFDQGLGDLFVVRLCDPFGSKLVLPSIEGAISKYDIKLVVLLAHHSGLNAQPTDIDAAVVQCIADWPQESDPIRNAQESKSLIIVPARYNLHSGQVEFLGETAAQLLDSAELQLDWK